MGRFYGKLCSGAKRICNFTRSPFTFCIPFVVVWIWLKAENVFLNPKSSFLFYFLFTHGCLVNEKGKTGKKSAPLNIWTSKFPNFS